MYPSIVEYDKRAHIVSEDCVSNDSFNLVTACLLHASCEVHSNWTVAKISFKKQ